MVQIFKGGKSAPQSGTKSRIAPDNFIVIEKLENRFTGELDKASYPVEFHVIGAGIAGLTAACALVDGNHTIHIWEKEMLPCMFSSSRNAAIFRTYESDPSLSILVKDSYRQLLIIEKKAGPLLDRRGLLIDPLELDYYEENFIEKFPDLTELKGSPDTFNFGDQFIFRGIKINQNGVLDIHAYQDFLIKSLAQKNVFFHYNKSLDKIEIKNGIITGIYDYHGNCTPVSEETILINAAGSWAMDIISKAGAWVPPVFPYKRHLFFIRSNTGALTQTGMYQANNVQMPVLWNEKRDVYIRPEADGFLATHCDQREVPAGDYTVDPKEVDRFLDAVLSVFPFLKDHHISRYWACLRTFSLDQLPVIGRDPYIKNLFWVAGLGGRGITMSPGMIPLINQILCNENYNSHNPFSPERFC